MNSLSKVRLILIMLVMLLFSVALAVPSVAQDGMSEGAPVTRTHVESHPSQGDVRQIEGASALLVRSEAGVSLHMITDELEANHVYTMWVVIMNDPTACETDPCSPPDVLGNSEAVGSEITWGDCILYSGATRPEFTAFIPAGDVPEAWYGNGLGDPLSAEVHIVINDHGEVIPDLAANMLNTYRGGCTDESLPPPFPDNAKADGEPGPNTCRLVQQVILTAKREVVINRCEPLSSFLPSP